MKSIIATNTSSETLRQLTLMELSQEEARCLTCGCGYTHPTWEWLGSRVYMWCGKVWIVRCLVLTMARELGDLKDDFSSNKGQGESTYQGYEVWGS